MDTHRTPTRQAEQSLHALVPTPGIPGDRVSCLSFSGQLPWGQAVRPAAPFRFGEADPPCADVDPVAACRVWLVRCLQYLVRSSLRVAHVETRGARARGIAIGNRGNPIMPILGSAFYTGLRRQHVLVSSTNHPEPSLEGQRGGTMPPRNHGACTRTNGLPPCSSDAASPPLPRATPSTYHGSAR